MRENSHVAGFVCTKKKYKTKQNKKERKEKKKRRCRIYANPYSKLVVCCEKYTISDKVYFRRIFVDIVRLFSQKNDTQSDCNFTKRKVP